MKPKLVVFEDNKFFSSLAPFSCVRGAASLRKGCLRQEQRLARSFADVADYLGVFALHELHLAGGDWLLVNAAISPNAQIVEKIKSLSAGTFLCEEGSKRVVACRLNVSKDYVFSHKELSHENIITCQSVLHQHWWDFVADNGTQIDEDFQEFYSGQDGFSVPSQFTTLLNPYSIWLGKDVELDVGAILDARAGAIVLEDGVKIGSNALVQGPCFVGKGSIVRPFADLKNGTTIGKCCKVGGEIDGSIIDDFSNKQHYGFIGESYVGSWVNLGAGTTCSDLKNNYSTVKSFSSGESKIDTKRQFLGCVIGDYTRLGIGSMINTGAYIGVGCCLYGSKVIEGRVGNLRFGKVESTELYDLEKFLQTLQVVKSRRQQEISEKEEEKIKQIFNKELRNYVD